MLTVHHLKCCNVVKLKVKEWIRVKNSHYTPSSLKTPLGDWLCLILVELQFITVGSSHLALRTYDLISYVGVFLDSSYMCPWCIVPFFYLSSSF